MRRVSKGSASGAATRRRKGAVTGKVKVHDPFELIRWLALSQSDPRKALAELVQNSLDAGARMVRIIRVREHRRPCVNILDDGEGVIPEMDRPEALHYIATHIGHSRKRALSPKERLQLMTQGQYGIGLLGFWSLGEALEIRTSVPGQRPHRLVLHRDRPDFLIEPIRNRDLFAERWTEVVVVDLHREAMPVLAGRRIADYLAAELRGQLLARRVDVLIEDKIARGRSEKLLPVEPPRFLGERIRGLDRLPLAGYPPIQLEIYLAAPEQAEGHRGIAVYAAGTQVAESFHDLAAFGLDRAPWTDPRLTGLVDFPALTVAPGSRRGIVPDRAASAFALALDAAEPLLAATLADAERRRAEELDRGMIRDLQRAFRDFYRERARYALLPVAEARAAGPPEETEASPATDAVVPGGAASEPDALVGAAEEPEPPEADIAPLFPAGPLASVEILPARLSLLRGTARRVRALARDAGGRPVGESVAFAWTLPASLGSVAAEPERPERAVVRAAEEPGSGSLTVVATSPRREAVGHAIVEVLEERPAGRSNEGIPEPELADHPGAPWRSRLLDGRWQVNTAHPDYRAIAGTPTLKVRYLAMLFAKEVVLRSAQDPRLEKPLEQLVEVAAYADWNLAAGRGGRRKRKGEVMDKEQDREEIT